jgi:hypothetical protein
MSSHYDFPLPIYNTNKPKHSRPKHQTSRSITETAYPTSRKHHHIHRHHHKHKDNDSSSAPNLHPNGVPIDGSKSEFVTPEESRNTSRRVSLLEISGDIEASAITDSWREERRAVKDGEIVKEKERAALRST